VPPLISGGACALLIEKRISLNIIHLPHFGGIYISVIISQLKFISVKIQALPDKSSAQLSPVHPARASRRRRVLGRGALPPPAPTFRRDAKGWAPRSYIFVNSAHFSYIFVGYFFTRYKLWVYNGLKFYLRYTEGFKHTSIVFFIALAYHLLGLWLYFMS
jgi:hypothetical protein